MRQRKLVIVGDSYVGKTSLLTVIGGERYPVEYDPQHLYVGYSKPVRVDGHKVALGLWDPGVVGSGPLALANAAFRGRCYMDCDIIVVCFAIDNPTSFRNVRECWQPEILHFCSGFTAPILLVGCKLDTRVTQETQEGRVNGKEMISPERGRLLAGEIGAMAYIECSAKTGIGVAEVVHTAIRVVSTGNSKTL